MYRETVTNHLLLWAECGTVRIAPTALQYDIVTPLLMQTSFFQFIIVKDIGEHRENVLEHIKSPHPHPSPQGKKSYVSMK